MIPVLWSAILHVKSIIVCTVRHLNYETSYWKISNFVDDDLWSKFETFSSHFSSAILFRKWAGRAISMLFTAQCRLSEPWLISPPKHYHIKTWTKWLTFGRSNLQHFFLKGAFCVLIHNLVNIHWTTGDLNQWWINVLTVLHMSIHLIDNNITNSQERRFDDTESCHGAEYTQKQTIKRRLKTKCAHILLF